MPSGKGLIVNWDRRYCIQCKRQFKSKMSLFMHLIRSKAHSSKEKRRIEEERKKTLTLDKFTEKEETCSICGETKPGFKFIINTSICVRCFNKPENKDKIFLK